MLLNVCSEVNGPSYHPFLLEHSAKINGGLKPAPDLGINGSFYLII